jgi:hypothetical protein
LHRSNISYLLAIQGRRHCLFIAIIQTTALNMQVSTYEKDECDLSNLAISKSRTSETLYTDIEGGSYGSEGSDDGNYDAVVPERSPAVLSWENLTITAKAKKAGAEPKILLNDLTGTVTGGVWAIMGSSGSGRKSSLGSN